MRCDSTVRGAEDGPIRATPGENDPLTELLDRAAFGKIVEVGIAGGSEVALISLGLNSFRSVNEMFGLATGDQVLREAARRLRQLTAATDAVARIGADEFAIFPAAGPRPGNSRKLCQQIINALTEPYAVESHLIRIGVSVGVAVAPFDATAATDLIRYSQLAAQYAKNDGGNVVRYFEPKMSSALETRRRLEQELRDAIGNDQFEMLYQPVLDLETERIVSVEGLIRWQHPTLGRVSPGDFIPVAEETGLIVPIGEWALRKACRDAAEWPESVRVAVNVSPVQLRSREFCSVVRSALREAALAPSRLELEVTETALMSNSELALAILRDIREAGVTVALDDFGTGYSSINYLRRFPFDKIKIDRSFVAGANSNPEGQALVKMIAALGVSLDVSTTAEGVETLNELKAIKDAGCTQMQGYYLSRPVAKGDFVRLLERSQQHGETTSPQGLQPC